MNAHADSKRAVLPADLIEDPHAQTHGIGGIGDMDHDCVADRLHLVGAVLRQKSANTPAELSGRVGGELVTVDLGQGDEAGQVRKQEGVLSLPHRLKLASQSPDCDPTGDTQ